MDRYLIVADDFTGSNDTGVQLKKYGIETNVVFSSELVNNNQSSFVIDTESRGMCEEEAYNTVKDIIKGIDFSNIKYVYKKVDSTLRGNIGAEIKAVDEIYKSDIIVFAPALPDLKRTTVNGIHMLNNVPITHTEIAKDPRKPVKEDNINMLLKNGFNEKVCHVSLEKIRNGKFDFSKERIYTFDAETNEDLVTIARKCLQLDKKVLFVGSAGLASSILKVNIPIKPAMAVIGSISDVSRRQLLHAISNGTYSLIKVNIGDILKDNNTNAIVKEIIDKINNGLDVIIASSYEREDYNRDIEIGKTLGYSKEEVSLFTQRVLGEIVDEVLQNAEISGMFLTGGDTAIGVIKKLNATGSCIKEEVMTGIPLVTLIGGKCDGLKVITKAGAFGEDNALEYCLKKLKEDI